MMCTREWLREYYDRPMSEFRAIFRSSACQRFLARAASCLHPVFPVKSPSALQHAFAWRAIFLLVPTVIWLIVLASFFAIPWVNLRPARLNGFIALATLEVVIGYVGRFVVGKPGIVIVVWMMAMMGIGLGALIIGILCHIEVAHDYEN
jgi:hypothetical protein